MSSNVQIDFDTETKSLKLSENNFSFDKGFFVAVRAIQVLREQLNQPVVVVGIAGPSGSGKSSMASKIQSVVDCAIIGLDNYFDGTKVVDENFDDPNNFDWELLVEHLQEARKGEAIDVPVYSYKKSRRVDYKRVEVNNGIVIVEGIYCLHAIVRPFLDLKVSIVGGVHFDLIKRIMRDVQRTGQTPKEAIAQMADTVFPMYKTFIEPDLRLADLKITNTFDPLSSLHNPLFILKTKQVVDPEEVKQLLKKGTFRYKSDKYFDIYLYPPNATTLNSGKDWIRVRQSGSKFIIYFCEWLRDGDFIISPRLDFEVSVKTLGGLMALGYQIGATMGRQSEIYKDDELMFSFDTIPELNQTWLQIKALDRSTVSKAAEALGIEEFAQKSYIELMVSEKLVRESTDPTLQDLIGASVSDMSPLSTILQRAKALSSTDDDGEEEDEKASSSSSSGSSSAKNTYSSKLGELGEAPPSPATLVKQELESQGSVGMNALYDNLAAGERTAENPVVSELAVGDVDLDAPVTMRDLLALQEQLSRERQYRIALQRSLYSLQQRLRRIGTLFKDDEEM